MTLLELQDKLSKQIEDITDERLPYETRRKVAEVALVVSSLAKQMINNADVVLRATKFVADSKLEDAPIMKMVSGGYLLMENGEDGVLTGHTIGK